jgi:hypothetical protein
MKELQVKKIFILIFILKKKLIRTYIQLNITYIFKIQVNENLFNEDDIKLFEKGGFALSDSESLNDVYYHFIYNLSSR